MASPLSPDTAVSKISRSGELLEYCEPGLAIELESPGGRFHARRGRFLRSPLHLEVVLVVGGDARERRRGTPTRVVVAAGRGQWAFPSRGFLPGGGRSP